MKNSLLALAKIGVTVVIIVFLLSRVDLAAMGRHLAAANPVFLLLALALYLFAIFLGAVKWQILTRAQGLPSSLGDLLAYSFVGLFFGNLLPSNVGGDVVRAYGLVRVSGRAEAAAISVLVDRLMGLATYVGAAMIMAALAAVVVTRAELEQIEAAAAFAAVLFIVAMALLFSRRVSRRVKWVFDYAPLARVRPIAERIYRALQVYRHSYLALALNLLLSGCIVIITTIVWYTVARGLGVDVSPFYFFLFNPLIAFVTLLPISLNGLGPKEATAVFFFGLIGVPSEVALAMSLVFHLLIVLTSLPGGVLWWREKRLAPPRVVVTE
ncbi:MAG: flippase-like domain-containing protein [Chloroflexi bacterium]|nr:flippase-like domain-containing protein [Chloroflexota bacterium]